MNTVDIDADVTYELDVTHFDPGSSGAWGHDDGHGAEIELGNIVTVWLSPTRTEVTTFNVFLLSFAAYHDMSLDEAERCVQDQAIEIMNDHLAAMRERDY